jgi:hypothetical protein
MMMMITCLEKNLRLNNCCNDLPILSLQDFAFKVQTASTRSIFTDCALMQVYPRNPVGGGGGWWDINSRIKLELHCLSEGEKHRSQLE